MEIRPAHIEDAARMARLLKQLGYERTPAGIARHIAAAVSNPEVVVLVAAMPDGQIAGCLQALVSRRLAEGDCGEIASLVVDSTWRCRGIGAQLIRAAIQWLRAIDIKRLRVRCNTKREPTHRFYTQLGFETTKTQTVFDRHIGNLPPCSE